MAAVSVTRNSAANAVSVHSGASWIAAVINEAAKIGVPTGLTLTADVTGTVLTLTLA